jgi:hypothetical protein
LLGGVVRRSLLGGFGDDLQGGIGADRLDGGDGVDGHSSSSAGVSVELNYGYGAGDASG